MKLNYMENGRQVWSSWKDDTDCTESEKKLANLRGLYDDEVILDSESREHSNEVQKQLQKDNINFQMWKTGSRGCHFHLRVSGLDQLPDDDKKKYRELFIVKYNCDIAKKSGVIARENKPHFKTGNVKTLIKETKQQFNPLNQEILQKIKPNSWYTIKLTDTTAEQLKSMLPVSKLIQELGGTVHPNGLANCCLHLPDKNPSMTYDDNKGLWYCFHQQKGGDVFTLIQEKKAVSFVESKRIVAELTGNPDFELVSEDQQLDFGLKPVSDIIVQDIQKPRFRVKDLIPEAGVTYIAAPPGLGKTLVSLYMGCCITTGEPFLGKEVIPGKVMYFDAENGEICAYNRLKSIAEGHGMPADKLKDFYYSIFPHIRFDLNHESYGSMISLTREFKPDVLVFDSLVRFMEGSENDAESCKKVFDFLRVLLKDNPNLTIIILHHVSKMNGGGMNAMRGSSELAASASTILMLHRKKAGIQITVEKSRYLDLNQDNSLYYKVKDEAGLYFSKESIEDSPHDAVGIAMEEWEEWTVKNNIEEFTTKNMMDRMIKKGHSKDAIYKLIHYLLEKGTIAKIRHGVYKIEIPVVSLE